MIIKQIHKTEHWIISVWCWQNEKNLKLILLVNYFLADFIDFNYDNSCYMHATYWCRNMITYILGGVNETYKMQKPIK